MDYLPTYVPEAELEAELNIEFLNFVQAEQQGTAEGKQGGYYKIQ